MVESVVGADVPALDSTRVDDGGPTGPRSPSTKARIDHASREDRPDTRALRRIGLDAVMDRRQLEQLALHTDVITVARGTSLARAGYSARQFVAVIDGNVDVTDVQADRMSPGQARTSAAPSSSTSGRTPRPSSPVPTATSS